MAKINVRDRNKNQADKKPNWEYRFEAAKIGGKRQHISKAGFRTKKDAIEAGAHAFAQYNSTGLHFEPSEISVNDYLDFWLEQNCKVNLRYNTQISYTSIVELQIKPHFGTYKLKTLNATALQEFANQICYKGYSRSYNRAILKTFQIALDYAVFPLQYIKENPMRYIKYPDIGKKRKERRILSNGDYDTIIKRFPIGNRYHLSLFLGWNCGLRISETHALTWDDIDWENKTISINKQIIKRNIGTDPRFALITTGKIKEKGGWYFTETKCDSNRLVKISDYCLAHLKLVKEMQGKNEDFYADSYSVHVIKEEKDEKGVLIQRINCIKKCVDTPLPRTYLICVTENGEYTSPDSFKYASRVINAELNINFSYHALRHSHATILIENGASPKAVQQRLGHKSITTTLQTYVHTTEKMEYEAVEIFDKATQNDLSTLSKKGGQEVDT